MMNKKDLNIAMELKKRLSEQVRLVDMSVFGSRARGNAAEDSDMDVFIEVDSLDKKLKEQILDITWEIGLENLMVISPLIVSRDELDNSPLRSSSIIRSIRQEGYRI